MTSVEPFQPLASTVSGPGIAIIGPPGDTGATFSTATLLTTGTTTGVVPVALPGRAIQVNDLVISTNANSIGFYGRVTAVASQTSVTVAYIGSMRGAQGIDGPPGAGWNYDPWGQIQPNFMSVLQAGFESGVPGATGTTTTVSVATAPEPVRTGIYSLKCVATAAGSTPRATLTPRITLDPSIGNNNGRIYLSSWVYPLGGSVSATGQSPAGTIRHYVVFYNAAGVIVPTVAGQPASTQYGPYTTAARLPLNQWSQLRSTYLVPATTVSVSWVVIDATGGVAGDTWYIDDCAIHASHVPWLQRTVGTDTPWTDAFRGQRRTTSQLSPLIDNWLDSDASGFEGGTTGGWQPGPVPAQIGGGGAVSVLENSTDMARTGTRSLKMTLGDTPTGVSVYSLQRAPSVGGEAVPVPVGSDGQTVTLTGWVYSTAGAPQIRAQLLWLSSQPSDNALDNGASVLGAFVSLIAGRWVRLTVTATVPANTTGVFPSFAFGAGFGTPGGVYYWDDITLATDQSVSGVRATVDQTVSTVTDVILDRKPLHQWDFQDGTTQGWVGGAAGVTVESSSEQVRPGRTYALKATTVTGTPTTILTRQVTGYELHPLIPGRTIRLSCWIYPATAARINMRWYLNQGAPVYNLYPNYQNSPLVVNQWNYVEAWANVPANMLAFAIFGPLNNPASQPTGDVWYVDDVRIDLDFPPRSFLVTATTTLAVPPWATRADILCLGGGGGGGGGGGSTAGNIVQAGGGGGGGGAAVPVWRSIPAQPGGSITCTIGAGGAGGAAGAVGGHGGFGAIGAVSSVQAVGNWLGVTAPILVVAAGGGGGGRGTLNQAPTVTAGGVPNAGPSPNTADGATNINPFGGRGWIGFGGSSGNPAQGANWGSDMTIGGAGGGLGVAGARGGAGGGVGSIAIGVGGLATAGTAPTTMFGTAGVAATLPGCGGGGGGGAASDGTTNGTGGAGGAGAPGQIVVSFYRDT